VQLAATKVVEKAAALASHLMEVDPGDLEFQAGTFRVKGSRARRSRSRRSRSRVLRTLAARRYAAVLTADHILDPQVFSFPHGTHLSAVEVDTETGMVKIRSYSRRRRRQGGQSHDRRRSGARRCGQGIAQALFEEAVYDADGNLITGTMVDYLVPTAVDLPAFVTDRTETPATTNPLGVKGVGEAGTIASTPPPSRGGDAVRQSRVRLQMPCTPERVLARRPAGQGGAASRHDGRGVEAMVPASPTPLTPSGFVVAGVSVRS